MNVKILNVDEIRESIPIEIEIEGSVGRPVISVENLGSVKAKKVKDQYLANFWVMQAGDYLIKVNDEASSWKSVVHVKEQNYLTFNQEFSFFASIFICTVLGVVLWMKKLKKTKN